MKSLQNYTIYLFGIFFFSSAVQSANIFDAFSSSLDSLFTDQEEAPYTLIKRTHGYEERTYDALNWVCAEPKEIKKSISTGDQQETFLKLFSYLQKENDEAVDIDMAIPVSIEFLNEDKAPSPLLTACFFIGSDFQAIPPAPTDPTVNITRREPMTIFTRQFGGYIDKPSEWLKEAKSLKTVVEKQGEKIRKDLMYWNAFDSPLKFWNRRNEVWLVKDNTN